MTLASASQEFHEVDDLVRDEGAPVPERGVLLHAFAFARQVQEHFDVLFGETRNVYVKPSTHGYSMSLRDCDQTAIQIVLQIHKRQDKR